MKTATKRKPKAKAADDGPLVTRVRLYDGRVYVVVETDGGSEVSQTCVGPLAEDIDFGAIPAEHWATVERWIADEAEAVRYGRDCRREAEVYY
jgi:hypothetical protein